MTLKKPNTLKVIYVDEMPLERISIARELRELLPAEFLVDAIPPYPEMESYLEVLRDETVSALIIDEKLKNLGGASYFGIELARYLRSYFPKLPIFILTNYPNQDELKESPYEWNVDYVLDKRDLNDERTALILASRLVRRTVGYAEIRDKRSERFAVLLGKSLSSALSEEEQKEFDELQSERVGYTVTKESESPSNEVKALEDLLNELRSIKKDLSRDE